MLPKEKLRGTMRLRGKKLIVPVIKCFVIPPNSKLEKKTVKKLLTLHQLAHKCTAVSGSLHSLVMCELKVKVVVSLGSF